MPRRNYHKQIIVDDGDESRRVWIFALAWIFFISLSTSISAQSSSSPLSKDIVVQLLSGGVESKRVASIAEKRKIDFVLDSEVEMQLRRAGAEDVLIETLRRVAPKPPQTVTQGRDQVPPVPPAVASTAAPVRQSGESDFEAKRAFDEAQSELKLKKYEEAVTLFGRAAREKPGWSEPLVERAKLETKLGRFTDAIEDCSEALRLSPNDAIALYFRGFAKYQLNRNDEAITDFNVALRLKPNYPEAYQNRGNAKWAIGDKLGANSDFALARSFQGGKR